MKDVYGCEGVSTHRHNEASGTQGGWYYHLHVHPRSPENNLYTIDKGEVMVAPANGSATPPGCVRIGKGRGLGKMIFFRKVTGGKRLVLSVGSRLF